MAQSASRPTRIKKKGIVLGKFKERINTVTVEYDGQTCEVRYWPGRFNDEQTRLSTGRKNADDGYDDMDMINETIINVVESWDIYDGVESLDEITADMPTVPPEDIVQDLELPFKTAVLEAIGKDMRPGEVSRRR